jgi:NitT/TauT family transport system substrate-binding protein
MPLQRRSPASPRRRGLRALGLATAILAGVTALAGCSQSGSTNDDKTLPTVSFGVLRAPTGALGVVADDKGWFEDAGVNVDFQSFAEGGGPAIIQAMASGKPDIALLNLATAVLALSQNSFNVQIVGIPDDPVDALPLLAKPGITSVKDLKGKTVSTPPNGGQYYLLSQILKANGMTFDDIDFKPLAAGDAQAAFIAGSLDAVISSANGTVLIKQALPDTKVIATGNKLGGGADPVVNPDVFVATRDVIKKHPDAVKAFVETYEGKAASYLNDSSTRSKAIDAIEKYMKSVGAGAQELESSVASIDSIKFYGYDKATQMLSSSSFKDALAAQADYWYQTGVLKTKPDLSDAINTSLAK